VVERIDHLLRHLSAPDTPGEPLPLEYGGETMHLDVSRRQLVNLLLSTYENILRQNTKLEEMHSQLTTASRQLEASLQKTQELLYRVFPREVADELANAGQSQPRHFDAVTVLFTDFVGFTRVAETMAPQQLINGLEEYFRRFDALTARCHMEKLKTIGDAYVAAGGVPTPNTTHALDAALLAVSVRQCVADVGREWEGTGMPSFAIRIGLHTGPLVAGVIGEQRFTYDLWGDTVNTASRMESGGEPGRINISAATHHLVEPFFECTPRGSIAVKNRTAVDMYFLERLRPEFSADPAGVTPNERFHEARERLRQGQG
jgi:class 3 adenylate cyclase